LERIVKRITFDTSSLNDKAMQLNTATKTKQVEAQYLSVGDKLSIGTVTHAPSVGINTPRGKVELGVNGYLKTWNKTTKITVIIE
jgi:hypothetical protein